MIYLRGVLACNRRTITISNMTNNLNEVPSWIAGNNLQLSKWNLDITFNSTSIHSLTNLSYPIEAHIDMGGDVRFDKIKLFRTIGTNELYFDMIPSSAYGQILDLYFEFIEKTDS